MANKTYQYQVFFILKSKGVSSLHHIFVIANNRATAISLARNTVLDETGRHAFRLTPVREDCSEKTAKEKIDNLKQYCTTV